eukprot:762145-Hanusia_phi.AAC.1
MFSVDYSLTRNARSFEGRVAVTITSARGLGSPIKYARDGQGKELGELVDAGGEGLWGRRGAAAGGVEECWYVRRVDDARGFLAGVGEEERRGEGKGGEGRGKGEKWERGEKRGREGKG